MPRCVKCKSSSEESIEEELEDFDKFNLDPVTAPARMHMDRLDKLDIIKDIDEQATYASGMVHHLRAEVSKGWPDKLDYMMQVCENRAVRIAHRSANLDATEEDHYESLEEIDGAIMYLNELKRYSPKRYDAEYDAAIENYRRMKHDVLKLCVESVEPLHGGA